MGGARAGGKGPLFGDNHAPEHAGDFRARQAQGVSVLGANAAFGHQNLQTGKRLGH